MIGIPLAVPGSWHVTGTLALARPIATPSDADQVVGPSPTVCSPLHDITLSDLSKCQKHDIIVLKMLVSHLYISFR